MARLVAYSDESENTVGQRIFTCAGWCGLSTVWERRFTARWQKEILDGPPEIDYFHAAEINGLTWRRKNNISEDDAEARIDRAITILEDARWLYPVVISVETDLYLRTMEQVRKDLVKPILEPMKSLLTNPDFFCFLIYCVEALRYAESLPGKTEFNTVAFVAEEKGKLSKWLKPAYEVAGNIDQQQMKAGLTTVGKASKSRPLEAADMLCWYFQKWHGKSLGDGKGLARFKRLTARSGRYVRLDEEYMKAYLKRHVDGLSALRKMM